MYLNLLAESAELKPTSSKYVLVGTIITIWVLTGTAMAQDASWRELANDDGAQNTEYDRPLVALNDIPQFVVVSFKALEDGSVEDGEYGEQLRVPVEVEDVDGGHLATTSELELEAGDEAVILTGANSIIRPLSDAYDSLQGAKFTISSAGPGQYDGYDVETGGDS